MKLCITCNTPTSNPKFCSQSCAAKTNNIGNRKHGKPANLCKVCGEKTRDSRAIYCSTKCTGISNLSQKSSKEKKSENAQRQARWRAKKLRVLAPDANAGLVKEFYKNRPDGYEVDHIIPLTKGGLHHQDNLQYLTVLENRKKGNRLVLEAGIEPARSFDKAL